MTDPACPASARTPRSPVFQFLRFALVGAAGTLLHYITLSLLVWSGIAAPGPAAAAGACAGACINYWLNYHYTFGGSGKHRATMPRFFALAALGVVLNGVIVSQLSHAGLHFLIAQLVATGLILILNFLISKKWIFQNLK